jgi:hypothetical protein
MRVRALLGWALRAQCHVHTHPHRFLGAHKQAGSGQRGRRAVEQL